MYDLFMNYWFVGIVFVCVYQLLSFIYMKSQGDKYIHTSKEESTPVVVVLFMNVLLTFLYPLFIVLMIVSMLDYNQYKKQVSKMSEDLLKTLESLEEKKELENE